GKPMKPTGIWRNGPGPVESPLSGRQDWEPDCSRMRRWETMSEQATGTPQTPQAVSPAWARIEKARHPQRPYPMDFIERIFTDFSEIHGDRAFGDDVAVACGMARLAGEEVMVIGNRKGGSTKERVKRNFGMPHPEGYRKALRAMRIAEKFSRPIISFIDLPGAYPGLGAEERGQAEAIAR